MILRRYVWLAVPVALFCAGNQPWKDKAITDWTEEDAKLVITASPWAKSVTPELTKPANSVGRPRMGRGGGMGRSGVGIGLPGGMGGMGGRRGGGGGYPNGGSYPGGGYPPRSNSPDADALSPPALALRWESALPIRTGELKARETSAPNIDEAHYAIAVYGVPRRLANEDPRSLAATLKKNAVLKREGKKDLKPSSVDVLQREDGPVIVYFFPRSTEITKADKRLEFSAQVGRLKLTESFFTEEMVFGGKIEL
jgi:hypothetical protein